MVEKNNPYIAGAPVVEKRMFYGREGVFEWIENSLTGKYVDHILVLHGQRRVGKTSVLKHIPNRLPDRYIPVFIDLQGRVSTSLDRFLNWLAREIVRALKEHGIDLPRPARAIFEEDPDYFETVFLPLVEEKMGERSLLLTFDEFDTFESTDAQEGLTIPFMAILKRLMDHPNLSFVFSIGSSGRKLENMQAAYTSFFKQALYRKISFLEDFDARDLIVRPVEGIVTYSNDAVHRIIEVTSGHPYFVQLVCHELFSECQKNDRWMVDVKDVEEILEPVVERGTVNLKFVWDEASDLEKWVLASLATDPDGMSLQELETHLKKEQVRFTRQELERSLLHLKEKDVLRENNDFIIHLLRIWLERNRPMEQVREELEEVNPIVNRLLEIGQEYHDKGEYERAIKNFKDALEAEQENLEAYLWLGNSQLAREDYGKAVAAFEVVLEVTVDDVLAQKGYCDASLAMGDEFRSEGKQEEAEYAYLQVLSINPNHQEAKLRMAEFHHHKAVNAIVGGEDVALDEMEKALEYTEEAAFKWVHTELKAFIAGERKLGEMLLFWGEHAQEMGLWDEASDLLNKYRREGGKDKSVTAAIEEIRGHIKERRQGELRRRAARLAILGHFDEAIESWNSYLIVTPEQSGEVKQKIAELQTQAKAAKAKKEGMSPILRNFLIGFVAILMVAISILRSNSDFQMVEAQILKPSPQENFEEFGYSIAISGDLMVVGADNSASGGINRGQVYVFENSGGFWRQIAILVASDQEDDDKFGFSVGISGNSVLVGAPSLDSGILKKGKVYFFNNVTTCNSPCKENKILVASDQANGDLFGYSVSFSGNNALVGAPNANSRGTNRGQAYIFSDMTICNNPCTEDKILIASDQKNEDQFGYSVGLTENIALVGAINADSGGVNRGQAYVYLDVLSCDGYCEENNILVASDQEDHDKFGNAVAIFGNIAIVGAPHADSGGLDYGKAYAYNDVSSCTSSCTEDKILIASDQFDHGEFGHSVAIYGNTALIGAPGVDSGGSWRGEAYLFSSVTNCKNPCTEQKILKASDQANSDYYGYSVSINNSYAIVGAPWAASEGINRGQIYATEDLPSSSYYPIVEEFNSNLGFSSTDPDLFIKNGKVHWQVSNNGISQFISRRIPEFSGPVHITVTGQVDYANNHCHIQVGIGDKPGSGVAVNFGYFNKGCETNGYLISAGSEFSDLAPYACATETDADWLWIDGSAEYTATITVSNDVFLEVQGVGSVTGVNSYSSVYNTLYIGTNNGGDWSYCSGSIDSVIIEPFKKVQRISNNDFDGDGLSDPAKFYPNNGFVAWLSSATGTWDSTWLGSETFAYVPRSDFNGDGITDPGKYYSSDGTVWNFQLSTNIWEGKYLGTESLKYIAGVDFDGDGITDPTKLLPNGEIWYIKSTTDDWNSFWLGSGDFEYVIGDFNGDGKDDPAKYVSSAGELWYWNSSKNEWVGIPLGLDEYIYVSDSDFDGDGRTDPAIFYVTTGTVKWLKSTTGQWDSIWMGPGTFDFVGGNDFDGDGITDPAKFDPETGILSWWKSSTLKWDNVEMGLDTYELVN